MSKNLIERLAKIQKNLVAPKNQRNNFGKYNYRSCEDILEGLKLVLDGLVVTISDDITVIADRVYVKATVTLTDGENSITNTALAREALTKKGMDESQITGACSSYARKYALNGMFLIDDNKDADSMDNKKQGTTIKPPVHSDILLISEMIVKKDVKGVKYNWSELIAKNWKSLSASQTEDLNHLYNQEG